MLVDGWPVNFYLECPTTGVDVQLAPRGQCDERKQPIAKAMRRQRVNGVCARRQAGETRGVNSGVGTSRR